MPKIEYGKQPPLQPVPCPFFPGLCARQSPLNSSFPVQLSLARLIFPFLYHLLEGSPFQSTLLTVLSSSRSLLLFFELITMILNFIYDNECQEKYEKEEREH